MNMNETTRVAPAPAPAPRAAAARRRLVVGAIGPGFDPATDAVLGVSAFAGAETHFPDWQDLGLAEPLASPAEVDADADDLAALVNHTIPGLAAELGRRHGVERGLAYWRVLLVWWLVDLASLCWFRFREVEAFLARHPGQSFSADILPQDMPWDFPGNSEFLVAANGDVAFNAWVTSRVLTALAPPTIRLRGLEAPHPAPPPAAAAPEGGGRRLLRAARARLEAGGRCKVMTEGSEHRFGLKLQATVWEAVLSAYLACLPAKPAIRQAAEVAVPDHIPGRFPAAFLEVYRDAVRRTMPRMLGADFAALDRRAAARRYVPGKLSVRVSRFYLQPDVLFRTAHAVGNGEGVISVQHGCHFGTASSLAIVAESEYRNHAFITWGWTAQADYAGTFLALPSPQLAPWRERHRETEPSLLFVANETLLTSPRIMPIGALFNRSAPYGGRVRFLGELAPQVLARALYRPYPKSTGAADDRAHLSARFPGLRFCDEGFYQRLLGCRLAVLDNPGTVFYQAMAANVPMVAFWDRRAWPMCRQAEPFFERLRAAGILFDDAAAAAARVDAVWPDVAGWWNGAQVQPARRAWCDAYARTDRLWWWQWMKGLWSL